MTTAAGQRGSGRTTSTTLRLARARGERRGSVFCVHGSGGGCLFFMPVARGIRDAHDVYGVQAYGMDHTVEPDTTMAAMAARYRTDILATDPTGPYAILGYSMGGIIAHEVARLLIAEGARVEVVGLLDTMMPGPPVHRRREDLLSLISLSLSLPEPYQPEEGLDWGAQCARFLAHAQSLGLLPKGFDQARLDRMVEMYDFNQNAVAEHRPHVLPVPLRLLVTVDGDARQDQEAWLEYGAPGGSVDELKADHFRLMSPLHAKEVAEVIRRWLDPAPDGGAGRR